MFINGNIYHQQKKQFFVSIFCSNTYGSVVAMDPAVASEVGIL